MKTETSMNTITENKYLNITFEFIVLIVTLFSLAIIVEYYMIPCLQSIAKKYNLSEQVTGYILALGSSIPEFSTNLISATSDHGKNINIGIGTVTGSGSFGIASFFTTVGGLNLNKTLYYRDSLIYLFTLTLLTFFLRDNIVSVYEALTLVLLFPVFLYISTIKLNNKGIDYDEINNSSFDKPHHAQDNVTKEMKPLIFDDTIKMPMTDDGTPNNHMTFDFDSKRSDILTHSQVTATANKEKSNIMYEGYLNEETVVLVEANKQNSFEIIKKEEIASSKGFYYYYTKVNDMYVYIYSYIFPNPQKFPIICFVLILLATFFHTRLTFYIIEKLSSYIKLTASFLALSLLCWGGNVGDIINASVATKLMAVDLLTTSILGSQVINLQLCLGLPWMISMMYGEKLEIDFRDKNPFKFLIPLYLVILAAIFIMTVFSVNLNKKSGVCLIIVYVIYLIYEFKTNIQ